MKNWGQYPVGELKNKNMIFKVRPDWEECIPKASMMEYEHDNIRYAKGIINDCIVENDTITLEVPFNDEYPFKILYIKRADEGGEFGISRQTGTPIEKEYKIVQKF